MTTTIMKDSIVGDAWIMEMTRLNQPTRVMDEATGQWNGNIRVFARLSFTEALHEAQKKMKSDPNSMFGFGCTLLFPPSTDFTLLWEEYNRICQSDFQSTWNGQSYGVTNPIRSCNEKLQFAGYTPNCFFTAVSSSYKPPIVDSANNPIVDPARTHAGVWAIVAVNAYASGKTKPNKGPRFGLQTIMIVADDSNLAGAPPDPKQVFKGVNVRPPTVQPSQHFGQSVATQPPGAGVAAFYPPSGGPPAAGIPGAWQPPPGGVIPPTPGPSFVPQVPQQQPQPAPAVPYDPLAQFR